ncbi:uncharacterized protein LOC124790139 [Schistocerca piceifrons]|uniref:uncharacterized protein LOC124790139 n=1 Tax=Schistocerca piceifrons TaxID=274613 RepID=UPI001F5E563E|nr:uncharacterized protein LOC124790139 [Schistocerca piceifrons]XP_047113682.1 uncharacterized protein LOC124790139 [Schistocerca piceifrons]
MKSQKSSPLLSFLVFCFFGGLGSLFPFLPLHMEAVGLTLFESRVVSVVSALVALLGPLLACPLADRLGGPRGQTIRVLLAATALLGAIFYALLNTIPTVRHLDARPPVVQFVCDPDGAAVMYEQCGDSCPQLDPDQASSLILHECYYDCFEAKGLSGEPEGTSAAVPATDDQPDESQTTVADESQTTPSTITDAMDLSETEPPEIDLEVPANPSDDGSRRRRQAKSESKKELPHLCLQADDGTQMCHVYTEFGGGIGLNTSLLSAAETEGRWCQYQLGQSVSCRVNDGPNCRVRCGLQQPYNLFPEPEKLCERSIGDPVLTFWLYLVIRSVADIFPTAGLALLDAALVIATRDKGGIGREFTWGGIGAAICAPIVGVITWLLDLTAYPVPFIAFAIMMAIFAVVAMVGRSLPFSRPEWWAHVHPLGGLKKHGGELAVLSVILLLMGGLWGALDSYLPWHLMELEDHNQLIIGLTVTVGALCAIPFLWNAEHVVEYCGHTNLLIIAFIFYIIRFTVFSYLSNAWWSLPCEIMEVFTLSLMWVTAILYTRHLAPRHLTATAQGMAVIFHFCLGRCLGALVAALLSAHADAEVLSLLTVYRVGAVVAAVIATVYFSVYYCCLKACCPAKGTTGPRSSGVTQGGPTSNGTYTPLRFYHNGSGQKEETKSQKRY